MSATPVRIQLSRRKGFNLQEVSKALNGLEAVNVCRPTIYGNPFVHDDAAVAVEAYERHCRGGTQTFEMGPGKLQFANRAHRNSLHWAFPEWLREGCRPSGARTSPAGAPSTRPAMPTCSCASRTSGARPHDRLRRLLAHRRCCRRHCAHRHHVAP